MTEYMLYFWLATNTSVSPALYQHTGGYDMFPTIESCRLAGKELAQEFAAENPRADEAKIKLFTLCMKR